MNSPQTPPLPQLPMAELPFTSAEIAHLNVLARRISACEQTIALDAWQPVGKAN